MGKGCFRRLFNPLNLNENNNNNNNKTDPNANKIPIKIFQQNSFHLISLKKFPITNTDYRNLP